MHSLLVPYLVWNLIAFLLYALKDVAAGSALQQPFGLDLFWGCKQRAAAGEGLFGLPIAPSTAPVQLQLWFVRDLIVLTLLSPLFYHLLRSRSLYGLALLALLYYVPLWPNHAGISSQGFWYFGLGAWCTLHQIDVVRAARRSLPVALPLAVAALVLSPIISGSPLPAVADRLIAEVYGYAALLSAIAIADRFAARHNPPSWLVASSFFLYASHTILLLPISTAAVSLTATAGSAAKIAAFVLCPLVATVCCLMAYALLTRSLPRLSSLLTGKSNS